MGHFSLAGIDEAGLGPILGPYTAASTRFRMPQKMHLYSSLHPLVQNEPHDHSLLVSDSKKVFSQKKGLKELEKSLLSFYCLKNPFPRNMNVFLSSVTSATFTLNETEIPWYKGLSNLELPLEANKAEILDYSGALKELMESLQIDFTGVALAVYTEDRFNSLLEQWDNKARACQIILNPLMLQALQEERLELHVDRQGGRRYYGEWLMELMPGKPLKALMEMKDQSVYMCEDRQVSFQVGADQSYLETALASMFAKYTREVMMKCFNQYWRERFPDIKPTAGYYTDGKRFLGELATKGVTTDLLNKMERKR